MTKKPFTGKGVQLYQEELYVLSDAALQEEARYVHNDFQNWFIDRFELTESQLEYVRNLELPFIGMASQLVSHYIGNRLPMSLNKTESNDDDGDDGGEDGRGKLILFGESQQAVYSQQSGTMLTGYLQVMIRYPKNQDQ
jgi:hypothetical protein